VDLVSVDSFAQVYKTLIFGNHEFIFPLRGIDNRLELTIFHFAGIRIMEFLPVHHSLTLHRLLGEY